MSTLLSRRIGISIFGLFTHYDLIDYETTILISTTLLICTTAAPLSKLGIFLYAETRKQTILRKTKSQCVNMWARFYSNR